MEDYVSGGTISRHVEAVSATLSVSIVDLAQYQAHHLGFGFPSKHADSFRRPRTFDLRVTAVGTNADVIVRVILPRADVSLVGDDYGEPSGGKGGAWWWWGVADASDWTTISEWVAGLEQGNPGWGVSITDDGAGTTWTIEFARATLAEGEHDVFLSWFHDDVVDHRHPALAWSLGTDGAPYDDEHTVTAECSSSTGAGTGDTAIVKVAALGTNVDGAIVIEWSPDPVTGEPVEFTIPWTQFGSSSTATLIVRIGGTPIPDAVVTSEPTTISNPDGHSIGAWTSPGSGVQWECEIAVVATAPNTPTSITFATTPSVPGEINVTWVTLVSDLDAPDDLFSIGGYGTSIVTVEEAIEVDADSDITVPSSAVQWASFAAAHSLAAQPSHLWLFQEPSSPVEDQIGSIDLAESGSIVAYQFDTDGWDRDGVLIGGGCLSNGGHSLDPDAQSFAVYAIVNFQTPTSNGEIWRLGGVYVLRHAGTGRLSVTVVGGGTTAGTESYTDDTFPLVLSYDRTNTRVRLTTDRETFTVGYASDPGSGALAFGSIDFFDTGVNVLYGALFLGADAEWLSTQANAEALLAAAGWPPP